MSANDLRTFWLLYGIYGPTMSFEDLRKEFYPSITIKPGLQMYNGSGRYSGAGASAGLGGTER